LWTHTVADPRPRKGTITCPEPKTVRQTPHRLANGLANFSRSQAADGARVESSADDRSRGALRWVTERRRLVRSVVLPGR
jgi:hypothetical protein